MLLGQLRGDVELAGAADGFGAVADAELAKDFVGIKFDGTNREDELIGNFSIGVSAGQQI